MRRRTAPYELNIRETSSYKTELSCFPLHAHALRLLMGKLPCFNLLFIASVFYQQKTVCAKNPRTPRLAFSYGQKCI